MRWLHRAHPDHAVNTDAHRWRFAPRWSPVRIYNNFSTLARKVPANRDRLAAAVIPSLRSAKQDWNSPGCRFTRPGACRASCSRTQGRMRTHACG
jgi:hypothetical protein